MGLLSSAFPSYSTGSPSPRHLSIRPQLPPSFGCPASHSLLCRPALLRASPSLRPFSAFVSCWPFRRPPLLLLWGFASAYSSLFPLAWRSPRLLRASLLLPVSCTHRSFIFRVRGACLSGRAAQAVVLGFFPHPLCCVPSLGRWFLFLGGSVPVSPVSRSPSFALCGLFPALVPPVQPFPFPYA